MAEITWEDGLLKVDGERMPGELVQLSVDGAVKFDEQKTDQSSGSKRTPQGWEDTKVSITLDLLTDDDGDGDGTDCYEKLEAINKVFRGHDAKANPKIYDVTNRHLLARGVTKLIFSGLSSTENDQEDTITAVLSFVENNPPIIKTEKKVSKSAFDAVQKAKGKVPDIKPADGAGAGTGGAAGQKTRDISLGD